MFMILRYWKAIATALLVLVILGLYGRIVVLNTKIIKLTGDLELSNKHLEVSQISLKEMKISFDIQNEAITKLELTAQENLEKHKTELSRSAAVANKYKIQAQDLLNRKPQSNVSSCDNVNRLINEELKNARK